MLRVKFDCGNANHCVQVFESVNEGYAILHDKNNTKTYGLFLNPFNNNEGSAFIPLDRDETARYLNMLLESGVIDISARCAVTYNFTYAK